MKVTSVISIQPKVLSDFLIILSSSIGSLVCFLGLRQLGALCQFPPDSEPLGKLPGTGASEVIGALT